MCVCERDLKASFYGMYDWNEEATATRESERRSNKSHDNYFFFYQNHSLLDP